MPNSSSTTTPSHGSPAGVVDGPERQAGAGPAKLAQALLTKEAAKTVFGRQILNSSVLKHSAARTSRSTPDEDTDLNALRFLVHQFVLEPLDRLDQAGDKGFSSCPPRG